MKVSLGNQVASGAALAALILSQAGHADLPAFHRAPPESVQLINPLANQAKAIQSGGSLYLQHCAACHGLSAEGSGNVPALAHGAVQDATAGQVFWFITKGSISGAMPSWAWLPEEQRWQIVSYLQAPRTSPSAARASDVNKRT